MEKLKFRTATENDVPLILRFIRELADYERMLNDVVATEESLRKWIFDRKKAEVIFAEIDGTAVGMALYFYNFSTFVGKAGIYLEDLFVKKEFRGKGYGRALLNQIARTAIEQDCGRVEWACLDWNQPSIDFYRAMGAVPLNDWTLFRVSGEALTRLAG
jgi:GNAT superfamily N-acetyltransferase